MFRSKQEIADHDVKVVKEGSKWRRWLAILSLLIVTAGAARHFYLAWNEKHLLDQARACLRSGNVVGLRGALSSVLDRSPDNVDANRILVQISLATNSPDALTLSRRVVQLAPHHLEDQIAWAEAAIQNGNLPEALKAAKEVESAGSERADVKEVLGRIAELEGAIPKAESYYADALRLNPGSATYALHLWLLRLRSDDAQTRQKAREELAKIADVPECHLIAVRALLAEALLRNRLQSALELANALNNCPGRTFEDMLLCLRAFRDLGVPEFSAALSEAQDNATHTPSNIPRLLAWMNSNSLALVATEWAKSLPPILSTDPHIRAEIADSYASLGDWEALQRYVNNGNWGALDYLRTAFLARSMGAGVVPFGTVRLMWNDAISSAGFRGEPLMTLATKAFGWGWHAEATDALWKAAKSDRAPDALKGLFAFYSSTRDTRGLARVFGEMLHRTPDDPSTRNNFALYSLLTNHRDNNAFLVARDLHNQFPRDPAYASTYAFALHCQGKSALAVTMMESLTPEQQKESSTAAYYSIFLSAVGRSDDAKKFRELSRGAHLLPEEQALVDNEW